MKTSLITLLLFISCISSSAQEKVPLYLVKAKIDPASGIIECKTTIKNPIDSCFILNKDMEIHSIIVDGKKVNFHQNPSGFMPNSSEIAIESSVYNTIEIDYTGKIKAESYPPIISSVNMIKPEIVELAIYTCWYPKFKQGAVQFRLEADLPSNFVAVSNGLLKGQKKNNNRNITTWESFFPGFDIVLLAAPNLKKTEISNNGVTVEIYYDILPKTYVDSMKNNLIKSMNWLTKLFGSAPNKLIRVAYSPRSTWGYVRTPFIIVSEGNAMNWRQQKFGFARDFRYLTHEIAHYWWSSANTNTPEDWLNEGLAEYSAFIASENIIGKDFTDQLLREYKERTSSSGTETAIIETENSSPDRELNRYDKPTILFNDIRNKYGEEKLNRFLEALYVRFNATKIVNTASFLDEMEKQLGTDAKDFFSSALYRKKWNSVDSLPANNVYSDTDSTFIGTWHGKLTQMGAGYKVIMHVKITDRKLNITFDSPDQNVTGIQTSEPVIAGDSLSFKISAAGVTFKGILKRDTMELSGNWIQSGSTYPLILSKMSNLESANK